MVKGWTFARGCYNRARIHAYAERRFCARRVARAKQGLAHREAKRNDGCTAV